MCQFYSALVLRNGDVLDHPMLDSHSDLVVYHGLPDTSVHHQHFAKVELTPDDDTWLDPDRWTFRLDEETVPGWWGDVAGPVEATMRARAKRMVISTGEKRLIVDGCWIIGGTAVVRDVRAGRLMRVQDSAQVRGVRGSAQVRGVCGSAQVYDVWDSAQVHNVGPNVILDDSARAHLVSGASA